MRVINLLLLVAISKSAPKLRGAETLNQEMLPNIDEENQTVDEKTFSDPSGEEQISIDNASVEETVPEAISEESM